MMRITHLPYYNYEEVWVGDTPHLHSDTYAHTTHHSLQLLLLIQQKKHIRTYVLPRLQQPSWLVYIQRIKAVKASTPSLWINSKSSVAVGGRVLGKPAYTHHVKIAYSYSYRQARHLHRLPAKYNQKNVKRETLFCCF